jgi:hypothetical protein
MANYFRQFKILRLKVLPVVTLCLLPLLALVQAQTTPDPFDEFLKGVLDFQEPTGIRGTLRYIETDEQIIWLNWEERSDDRPMFRTGWKLIPGEATLAVHPDNAEQFAALKQLPMGTGLELIIQEQERGNRRILSYRDRAMPPKVPL